MSAPMGLDPERVLAGVAVTTQAGAQAAYARTDLTRWHSPALAAIVAIGAITPDPPGWDTEARCRAIAAALDAEGFHPDLGTTNVAVGLGALAYASPVFDDAAHTPGGGLWARHVVERYELRDAAIQAAEVARAAEQRWREAS